MLARHQTSQEEREIEIQWNHAEYELEKQKIIAESEREKMHNMQFCIAKTKRNRKKM
jgi:hypothetical protein